MAVILQQESYEAWLPTAQLHLSPKVQVLRIRLNYLAPDIVAAIPDGTQPPDLDRKSLLMSNVPTDWVLQRDLYGFPTPVRKIAPRNLFGRGMWPSVPSG